MKAIDKIKEVTRTLMPFGIEAAEREAELMIRYGLHIDPVKLYKDNPDLNKEDEHLIGQMVKRRTEHEPLQYILGNVDFINMKLEVGEGVLIPRPETEQMAEQALKTVKSYELRVMSKRQNPDQGFREINTKFQTPNSELRVLDLCTGSGCLALAIAKQFPEAVVTGCDSSEEALKVAERNAGINNITNVRFLKGDLFKAIRNEDAFDMIISNPPYIRKEEIKHLQPEVRDWEPLKALDGGEDGLDYYRRIIPEAVHYLTNKGLLMFEHGDGQSGDIAMMLHYAGYNQIEMIKDYSGKERVIQATWIR